MAEIIAALHPTSDGWQMAFWFRTPNNFLEGKRPEEILQSAPEKVVMAAQEAVGEYMHG